MIAFPQNSNDDGVTVVPDKTLNEMVKKLNEAKKSKLLLEQFKEERRQALRISAACDSNLNVTDSLLHKYEEIAALQEMITSIYKKRASTGNKLVVDAAVGAGFYAAGGKYREPEYVFGSMLVTHLLQEIWGEFIDIFTVDINPFY